MKKLVIASGNPGKLREFAQMLAPLGFEIVPQAQLGIPEAEEPHATFVENALAKARHASRLDAHACVRRRFGHLRGRARRRARRALGALRGTGRRGRARSAGRAQQSQAACRARGHARPARALLLRDRARAPCGRSRAADRRRPLARRGHSRASRGQRLRLRPLFPPAGAGPHRSGARARREERASAIAARRCASSSPGCRRVSQ